jgi:inner membrane protein
MDQDTTPQHNTSGDNESNYSPLTGESPEANQDAPREATFAASRRSGRRIDDAIAERKRTGRDARSSVLLKLFVTVLLGLILLVPASMIENLVEERAASREQAVRDISGKWGAEQTIGGPVLTVPFRQRASRTSGGKEETFWETGYAHFMPADLVIEGRIDPQVRHRGIYDAVLYNTKLKISGSFATPDLTVWGIKDEDIYWGSAVLTLGIPDMQGIRDRIRLKWNEQDLLFHPGLEEQDIFASGVTAELDPKAFTKANELRLTESHPGIHDRGAMHTFSVDLDLNGSQQLGFLPLGKETRVKLTSNWPDPSFSGTFLPETREVSAKGFTASWKVLDLNRNFPQQWLGSSQMIKGSEFGVGLMLPVDNYHQTTRSLKYAVMFIGLTFLTFFLVEILRKMRLHPIQYLLAGIAMVVFYLLLLSFSEQMGFGLAYLLASAGVIGLITLYMGTIFRRALTTFILFLILTLLYGYLYVLLEMQDYSLLLGSLGLFAILALVMYLTRKIDWYKASTELHEADTQPS